MDISKELINFHVKTLELRLRFKWTSEGMLTFAPNMMIYFPRLQKLHFNVRLDYLYPNRFGVILSDQIVKFLFQESDFTSLISTILHFHGEYNRLMAVCSDLACDTSMTYWVELSTDNTNVRIIYNNFKYFSFLE
jgi:hypothetical protein